MWHAVDHALLQISCAEHGGLPLGILFFEGKQLAQ